MTETLFCFRYDIMNFQKVRFGKSNASYQYSRVGQWDSGVLDMEDAEIYWPRTGKGEITESVCSKPCPKGNIKVNKSELHLKVKKKKYQGSPFWDD